MTDLGALMQIARATGDFRPFVDAIPFAKFLGISAEPRGEELIAKMAFQPHLVGNALIPALHGGTLGALLESASIFGLIWESRNMPFARGLKIVNITVEYLRSARAVDTYAHAEITKQGRRVVTVRAFAWQDDRDKPMAIANAHFLLPNRESQS